MIKMAWHIKLQRNRSDELSGLIEYYDAIFNREGLIKKESDFRSNKLSLILDLIRTTAYPMLLAYQIILGQILFINYQCLEAASPRKDVNTKK
jgi:hypothetical protein